MGLLFQSMELFCTSGSATEGKGFYFMLEALEALPHLLCNCPRTNIVTQWWGKQVCSRIPGTATDPCYALQVTVCWSCAVSSVFYSSQGEALFAGSTSSSVGHIGNCTRAESMCRHHSFSSLSLKGLYFAIDSDLC